MIDQFTKNFYWPSVAPMNCPYCNAELRFDGGDTVRYKCGVSFRFCDIMGTHEQTARCHGSEQNYRSHIANKLR